MSFAFWKDTPRIAETVTQPNEAAIRARAQSLMTRNGNVARLPTYAEALEIIAAHTSTPPSPSLPPLGGAGGGNPSEGESFTDSDLCTLENYRGY